MYIHINVCMGGFLLHGATPKWLDGLQYTSKSRPAVIPKSHHMGDFGGSPFSWEREWMIMGNSIDIEFPMPSSNQIWQWKMDHL